MSKTLLVIASVAMLACSNDPSTQVPAPEAVSQPEQALASQKSPIAKDLDPKAFADGLMESGGQAILLDVRTPEEVALGVIPGAQHIDIYEADFKERVKKLPKDQAVFVYCAAGGRSSQAMEYLSEQGYQEVYNLSGGIRAWLSAGQSTMPLQSAE